MDKYFIPKGPYAVLMTPFKFDGTIDWEAYEAEVEFLCQSPITGIFPCATTGEFVHMSPEENMKLIEVCARINKGRKRISAGACATNLDTVEMYARHAEKCGCDCIVVCVPYYITLPQAEIEEFFVRLSKRLTGINIMLYNIPMFTGEISIPTYERLLQCENIIGIKDSCQNLKRIAHLVDIKDEIRPDFAVFCGTDDMLVPALLAGCTGSMTAMSAIIPEVNAKIYELFEKGEILEAQTRSRCGQRACSLGGIFLCVGEMEFRYRASYNIRLRYRGETDSRAEDRGRQHRTSPACDTCLNVRGTKAAWCYGAFDWARDGHNSQEPF